MSDKPIPQEAAAAAEELSQIEALSTLLEMDTNKGPSTIAEAFSEKMRTEPGFGNKVHTDELRGWVICLREKHKTQTGNRSKDKLNRGMALQFQYTLDNPLQLESMCKHKAEDMLNREGPIGKENWGQVLTTVQDEMN